MNGHQRLVATAARARGGQEAARALGTPAGGGPGPPPCQAHYRARGFRVFTSFQPPSRAGSSRRARYRRLQEMDLAGWARGPGRAR